jgi:hypothetical protein
MTLHEAIEKALQLKNGLTNKEIAEILNKHSWYKRGDGTPLPAGQIGLRVKNYPQWFRKENGLVYLNKNANPTPKKIGTVMPKVNLDSERLASVNEDRSISELFNPKKFRFAKDIDKLVDDLPGFYVIRIADHSKLPISFSNVLKERSSDIIYIGLASKSLKKRFLYQELRAKGHGTFFRSIGSVLGYTPIAGSLKEKKNQNNFTFSSSDEQKIINWINTNLKVNWVPFDGVLEVIENTLIKKYKPLLNIKGNPFALQQLVKLRNECKRIARG